MTLRFDVIMDERENPRKCTIAPVAERPDIRVIPYRHNRSLPGLDADLLLHVDGCPLDQLPLEAVTSIAALDCYWRRCPTLLRQLPQPWPSLARIPNGFQTAYPRKSKDNSDPAGGLATIEALFVAAAFCGRWDESLLDRYYFAAPFLDCNRAIFARYGIHPDVEA